MNITYINFWDFSISQYARQISTQADFYQMLLTSAGAVRDFVYLPTQLKPASRAEIKITKTTFSDCSFAKTDFENLEFYNCNFFNCKFNLSKFIDCKFHDCKFTFVNMSFVQVTNSYLDANSFGNIIPNYRNFKIAVKSSNMCVTFFQTLYHNANDTGQEQHKLSADYHFQKWKGLNLIQKRFVNRPFSYKISLTEFLKKYPISLFQYIFTGYGYKIWNFLFSFLLGFSFFLTINHIMWKQFNVCERDVPLQSFSCIVPNFKTSIFYTLDATTKLIDSQMQPTSDSGMFWLCGQGVFGFLLLTGVINIISNKFVK